MARVGGLGGGAGLRGSEGGVSEADAGFLKQVDCDAVAVDSRAVALRDEAVDDFDDSVALASRCQHSGLGVMQCTPLPSPAIDHPGAVFFFNQIIFKFYTHTLRKMSGIVARVHWCDRLFCIKFSIE